jgi:hypothetical protein
MAQMRTCPNSLAGPGISSHDPLLHSPSHSNSCTIYCSIRRRSVVLGQVRYYVLLHQAIVLCKDREIVYTDWRFVFQICTSLEKLSAACHEWGSMGSAESTALEFQINYNTI